MNGLEWRMHKDHLLVSAIYQCVEAFRKQFCRLHFKSDFQIKILFHVLIADLFFVNSQNRKSSIVIPILCS
jgi:hypothetical protein